MGISSKFSFGSLFSGIGGFDLAFTRVGMTCSWQVEIDPFCQKVLTKHWPDVPKFGDIRECNETNLEPVDLICGGFPCQPFSVAGKRGGKDDNRYLWPEMLRIISELKPTWVVGENVAGIIEMALEQVCLDLEAQGYEVQPVIIPACAVNAPHRRDRVWIIGHAAERADAQDSNNNRVRGRGDGDTGRGERALQTSGSDRHAPGSGWEEDWPEVATNFLRMDDGIPLWFHRYIGGINNGAKIKNMPTEDLRMLRETLQSDEIRGSLRRLWDIPEEAFLLIEMLWLSRQPEKQNNLLQEGEAVCGEQVREMWRNGKTRSASFRREHQEQLKREHTNLLPSVPYEIALEIKEAWDYIRIAQNAVSSNRVDRLKSLGNAIVPQIAEWIGKIIMESASP